MYEDDDYYDDDDEEYEEEDSSRGLLIALVIVLILGVLAIFVAISILVTAQTGGFGKLFAQDDAPVDEDDRPVAKAEATPSQPTTEVEPDPDETAGELELDEGLNEDKKEVVGLETGGDPEPGPGSTRRGRSDFEDEYEEVEPTPRPQRRTESSRSSRSSSRASSRSAGSSSRRDSGRSSGSSSSGGGSRSITVNRSPSRSSTAGRGDSGSNDVARVMDDDDDTGGGEAQGSRTGTATMSYDQDSIASLGSKAAGGALTATQSSALKGVPGDSPNFTLAWATVMKNAEVKKDYKGHCKAANMVMTKSRNKYHPEWNLELAKCQLRNGNYLKAINSVDRTLGDSFGMTASTKTQRLLLAYQIKAQSRTRLYENDAKANAGVSDKNKLNSAIQAWMEYRNYASGTGNEKALQRANREVADLEERKGR